MIKNLLCFLLVVGALLTSSNLKGQTIYATKGSATWATTSNWETYSAGTDMSTTTVGSGTAAASTPSGTHVVYIRTGHTIDISATSPNVYSLTLENGATLSNPTTTSRTLRVGVGGTGFSYPIDATILNNGTISGAIILETGAMARNILLTGTGTTNIQRVRMGGGIGSSAGGVVSFTFDQNATLTVSGNYALSAIYNPTATDNYTININAGKIVTFSDPTSYFHVSSTANTVATGTYTYNINGTLDLSANTTPSSISPSALSGTVNLNVNGLLKLGTGFNSVPGAGNTANLTIGNGGEVDASLTTSMTFTGSWFKTNGTGTLKRNVANTDVLFPLGTTTYNPLTLSNSGTAGNVSASVKSTFDNAPTDATKVVNRQWTITPAGSGANLTVSLGWSTADQAASFNPANTVSISRYGTSWTPTTATVTGSSPYVASISGVTNFGRFLVENASSLPLDFLSFTAKPSTLGAVNLDWKTTNEVNTKNFEVQSRTAHTEFKTIGTVRSKNTSGIHQYTFSDDKPAASTVYYRLKQIDNDGKFKYSDVVSANVKSSLSVKIYPNPVSSVLSVSHPGEVSRLTIVNLQGKKLIQQTIALSTTSTEVNVSSLQAGTYIIMVEGKGIKSSLKFLKK